jgi:hypothetical protein
MTCKSGNGTVKKFDMLFLCNNQTIYFLVRAAAPLRLVPLIGVGEALSLVAISGYSGVFVAAIFVPVEGPERIPIEPCMGSEAPRDDKALALTD